MRGAVIVVTDAFVLKDEEKRRGRIKEMIIQHLVKQGLREDYCAMQTTSQNVDMEAVKKAGV